METGLYFYAERRFVRDEIALYGIRREGQRESFLGLPSLEPLEHGHVPETFLRLSMKEAQQIMDELWRCGVRPADAVSGNDTVEAMRHHLNDMRTMVFKQMGMETPK